MTNHRPEPKEHPGLVVVGDYLFDSTLNGLLDSSDAATDIIVTEMMKLRHARGENRATVSNKIDRDYFENYRGVGLYREVWQQFSDPDYLTSLIKITSIGLRTTSCWWRGPRAANWLARCAPAASMPGVSKTTA